jgi:hypothetical protein
MLPLTFCVKATTVGGEIDAKQLNSELKQFKQCFKLLSKFKGEDTALIEDAQPEISRLEMPLSHYQGKNAWILKPTGCNRGKGIHVVDSVKDVKKFIHQTCIENQSKVLKEKQIPETKTFVIQKYIESPFLMNKRKFDIRVWVLLTQDMDLHFFKEGYLRMSCADYSCE